MNANHVRDITGSKDLICLSDRDRRSTVWRGRGGIVYKSAPKVLIDTEFYFLGAMADSGYVPRPVVRLHDELISMPFITNSHVTWRDEFMSHYEPVLKALKNAQCRHGDLTEYSVFVNNNRPVIIDFGESRYLFSPFPDKRREGDRFWLKKTMEYYASQALGSELDL